MHANTATAASMKAMPRSGRADIREAYRGAQKKAPPGVTGRRVLPSTARRAPSAQNLMLTPASMLHE
ncbi:MAG: hypothetical protein AMXMBFR37_18560 [Steroidobacteraceae bacterium]